MKLKIATLTSAVIFVILVILEWFIYLAVYSRVMNVHKELLYSVTRSIAQEYASHAGEGGDGSSPTWLKQYVRLGQEVLIVDPNGKVLLSFGNLNPKLVRAHFQPTNRLVQSSIDLNRQLHLVLTIMPVPGEDGRRLIGYVVSAADDRDLQEFMSSLLTVLMFGGVGAVLLSGFGGYLVAAAGLRPIQALIRVVMRTGADRLDERVPVGKGHDELARLANQFNIMLARIERSFEQQRQFVVDASHEIRTPLTTILGYSSLLQRWGKTDPKVLEQAILVIQKEAGRLKTLAEDLLTLAGLESAIPETEHQISVIDDVVSEVVETTTLFHSSLEVRMNLNCHCKVRASSHHLRTMVSNLLTNAYKYTPEDGTIQVSTWKDAHAAFIEIADTGCGIPPEDLPHVFERFYRVDKSRERSQGGNGLGLAIVKGLSQLCGGRIDIKSIVSEGTTVTLVIPLDSTSL